MGWSGYRLVIHVRVDAHGGEREERGERLYQEFQKELEALCKKYSQDEEAMEVSF